MHTIIHLSNKCRQQTIQNVLWTFGTARFMHDYIDHCTTKQPYTPFLDKQIQNYAAQVSQVLKLYLAVRTQKPHKYCTTLSLSLSTCSASKSSRLEFIPNLLVNLPCKDSCFILSKTSSSCVHLRIHVDVDLRCIGEEMHIISMKHFVPSTAAIKNMRLNWRCDSWMWIILGAKRANLLFDMRIHNFICLLT